MKSLLCLIVISFLLVDRATAQDMGAIDTVMKAQENAWNKGDIVEFMSFYTTDSTLRFVTAKGITEGHQAVLDRYVKAYPTKASMDILTFEILDRQALGAAHCRLTGTWRLDGLETQPSGFFTLIWQWNGREWKIIYDHTS